MVNCNSNYLFCPWICSLDRALGWGMASDPSLPPHPHPIWGLNWNEFQGMVAGQASQSPQVGLSFLQHGSLRSVRFLTQWLRAPRANVPRFLGGSYKPFYVTAMEVPERHFCPILSSKLLLCSLDPRAKEFNWIQLYLPMGKVRKKLHSFLTYHNINSTNVQC